MYGVEVASLASDFEEYPIDLHWAPAVCNTSHEPSLLDAFLHSFIFVPSSISLSFPLRRFISAACYVVQRFTLSQYLCDYSSSLAMAMVVFFFMRRLDYVLHAPYSTLK